MHVTRDGGKNWANVTPKDMPDLGRVSQIDGSAFDPGAAYVAVKKPLLDDLAPYIFRTHDFGKTWTKIVTGIRPNDYVHVVREDPTRRGLLYAGTQHGVYVSFDDGDRWEPLSLNLPDTQISDLIVEANSLAIATHGRGFYILDNIAPLRQSGADVNNPAADAFLYKPADAIRSTSGATIAYLLEEAGGEADDRHPGCTRDRSCGRSPEAQRPAAAVAGSGTRCGVSCTCRGPGRPPVEALRHNERAAARRPEENPDAAAGGGRGRGGAPTASDGGGPEPVHVGSALCAGDQLSGHGALGRDGDAVLPRCPATTRSA